MKYACKKLVSVILAFILFFSLGMLTNKDTEQKAAADESVFTPSMYMPNIYYFCDSTPAVGNSYVGVNLYFDVHPMISPQEFAFMVYSGYFWKFDQYDSCDIAVIVEIKTMEPSQQVIEDLIVCLQAQNCDVMFVSPYISEYDFSTLLSPDVTIVEPDFVINEDNIDTYSSFIRTMMMEMANVPDLGMYPTIFIDGRTIGIETYMDDYDVGELCLLSPTLRRVLHYMLYGVEEECVFESDLFENLWELYIEVFVEPINYSSLNNVATAYPDIYDCIDVWRTIDNMDEYLSAEDYLLYEQRCNEIVELYYTELILQLDENNAHLLAHIENNTYIDIITGCMHTFNNYGDVLTQISDIDYMFGFGRSLFKTAFYQLMYNIQSNVANINENYTLGMYMAEFMVYIYIDEPIEQGEGLAVISSSRFFEGYEFIDEAALETEIMNKAQNILFN